MTQPFGLRSFGSMAGSVWQPFGLIDSLLGGDPLNLIGYRVCALVPPLRPQDQRLRSCVSSAWCWTRRANSQPSSATSSTSVVPPRPLQPPRAHTGKRDCGPYCLTAVLGGCGPDCLTAVLAGCGPHCRTAVLAGCGPHCLTTVLPAVSWNWTPARLSTPTAFWLVPGWYAHSLLAWCTCPLARRGARGRWHAGFRCRKGLACARTGDGRVSREAPPLWHLVWPWVVGRTTRWVVRAVASWVAWVAPLGAWGAPLVAWVAHWGCVGVDLGAVGCEMRWRGLRNGLRGLRNGKRGLRNGNPGL
jgi:hypothetical protein